MTDALAVSGLTKAYDGAQVVADVDLTLAEGSFTALLGPSGCGKSTTLQMIAGLIAPDRGRVVVDGVDVTTMTPERRPVSLVFQKPLLFPHLDVSQNVGFGLRMQRLPRAEISVRVSTVLERLQLGGLGSRRPHELSGGQEQRVALARALVLEPALLLLDEPFSQLDASLRRDMRGLVRELHDTSGITTLFVTHDQGEAVEIADRIVLMLDGAVECSGPPEQIYTDPPTLATARFLGVVNEIRGTVEGPSVRVAGQLVDVRPNAVTGAAVVVVRPEGLRLTSPDAPGAVSARVDAVRFAGTHVAISSRTDDDQVVTIHAAVGTHAPVGERVGVMIPPDRCTVFAETAS